MSQDHERLAGLVSRYAAGDLPDEERTEVAAHLASCAECRALADVASLLRDELARGAEAVTSHPEAPLLAGFALHPDGMPANTETFVADHVASCTACSDAVRVARGSKAVDDELAAGRDEARRTRLPDSRGQRSGVPWSAALWELLKGSLLRPELAVAYLLLLAVVVPYALRAPASAPAPADGGASVLPAAVLLEPDDVLRGEETGRGAVTEVRLDDGAPAVILALPADLDPLDWEIAGGPLELTVEAGGSTVFRTLLRPSAVDDAGVVRIALPDHLLERLVTHRVTIGVLGGDEPPLFEASFRPVGP